jgi:hypothetical protein
VVLRCPFPFHWCGAKPCSSLNGRAPPVAAERWGFESSGQGPLGSTVQAHLCTPTEQRAGGQDVMDTYVLGDLDYAAVAEAGVHRTPLRSGPNQKRSVSSRSASRDTVTCARSLVRTQRLIYGPCSWPLFGIPFSGPHFAESGGAARR